MNATITPKKPSFKQQQMQFRENAILDSVNRLLSQKGFDLMTMDEVAADVGIAKASLYKHFPSKESLAAASMTRLLDHTLAEISRVPTHLMSKDKLKMIVRWGITLHIQGEMPYLPSTRSSIQPALPAHAPARAFLLSPQITWVQSRTTIGQKKIISLRQKVHSDPPTSSAIRATA